MVSFIAPVPPATAGGETCDLTAAVTREVPYAMLHAVSSDMLAASMNQPAGSKGDGAGEDLVSDDDQLGPVVELRRRRQSLGMSLEQVARRAHLSAAQLSLVERGKRRPSRRSLTRLWEVLGLSSAASALPERNDSAVHGSDSEDGLQVGLESAVRHRRAIVVDTRSQSLYERLRHAIIHGELRPNQRLVEIDLAGDLNSSRTPIRECLQRLAIDGLVDHHGRGWTVHEHSASEVREIYEVRAALEGYAARLVSQRATPDELTTIKKLATPDPGRIHSSMPNESFHDSIIRATGNTHLIDTISRSRQYYFNHRLAVLYTDAERAEAWGDHQAIARAIEARDGDLSEALSRRHVETSLQIVLRVLTV